VDVDARAFVDWVLSEQADEAKEEDRWIRFLVADVNYEKVKRVCERLGESENIFGWTLDRDLC